MKNRIRTVLSILAAALLAAACQAPATPSSGGKASLTINVSNQINARTLAPGLDMNPASYTVTGTGPSGATFTATTSGGAVTKNNLAFGSWTVVVNATNSGGTLIGTGSATTQVNTASTSTVSVTVTPVSGVGILNLGVSWPNGSIQTPSIDSTLTPALGSAQTLPFSISGSSASYSNNAVGNGYYTLALTVKDTGVLVAGAVDVVRIVTGQTTGGTYAFSQVNAPGGAIQVNVDANLQNPLEVAISGTSASQTVGTTKTLTANVANYSGNVVYVWYVNGVSAATGSTFAFNSGSVAGYSYRIDVTAFSADGTRGGSATATVQGIPGNTGPVASDSILSDSLYFGLAIKNDNTLWAHGINSRGQVGDGTTTQRPSPVQVLTGVASASAGGAHSLALRTDGTLWAFGSDFYSQLGDGLTTDSHVPKQVASGVKSICATTYNSFWITSDETLWGVGYNFTGALGDGSTTTRNIPIQIMTNVSSVSSGGNHTLIVRKDGTLWATGDGTYGELGDGANHPRSSPIQVMTDVTSAAAGYYYTSFAIKSDGSLWAFGYNLGGVLGDGTYVNRNIPVQIMSDVKSVSAGVYHTLIVKNDGTLWAVGTNWKGELGDGTTTDRNSPIQVMSGVARASAGYYFSHVLKADGTLWAFGANDVGQLGDGTTMDRGSPVQIAGWPF